MARKARNDMIVETRSKLIAAARKAFGEAGYAGTSMDVFTASVGLTRGALYHHFSDKKGLLRAVAETIDAEIDLRLRMITENNANLWQGFVGRCRVYLEMALEPEVQRIVLRDAPSVLGATYAQDSQRQCLASLANILAALMEEGTIKQGDADMLARLINGALVDATLWIGDGDTPENRLATAIGSVDLLLSGLKKR